MDLQLQGKIALVSGSTRGIGLAVAKTFFTEGAHVIITGRDMDSMKMALDSFGGTSERLVGVQADMTRREDIQRVLDFTLGMYGAIDCLVANVGSGQGSAEMLPARGEWDRLLNINFFAATELINTVLPSMLERKSGSITLINSIVSLEATPAPLPYSAAKAALLNYANNLSRRVASDGIRVNSVAPGNIFFPGGSWEKHLEARKDEVQDYIMKEVPMRRFGTPEEVASAVVYLSSPRASFITGACLLVDGGQTR